MSRSLESSESFDWLPFNEYPEYSIAEVQSGAQYQQIIDSYGSIADWAPNPDHRCGLAAFNPFPYSNSLLGFGGSEALPPSPYSPASSTGMTLGIPTPTTGQFSSKGSQSSAPHPDSTSSTNDQRAPSLSMQSLSPALSNDLVAPSPKSEQKEAPPRRAASAPEGRTKPRRKTHNAIEKRYRTRLNDKISELRDKIPSLRDQPAEASGKNIPPHPTGDCNAQKVNKANILEKATEYIQYLEACNHRLQEQLDQALLASRPVGQIYDGMVLPENRMDPGGNCSLPTYPRAQPTEHFAYTVHDLVPDDTASFR